MKGSITSWLPIALITVGLTLPASVVAETATVQPKTAPNLQIRWLSGLTLSPTTVVVGSDVTGTVVLLRPAAENLVVALELEGARLDESGIQVAPGARAPVNVTVPAGSDRATFRVSTRAETGVSLPKRYALTARIPNESASASFTVNPPLLRR